MAWIPASFLGMLPTAIDRSPKGDASAGTMTASAPSLALVIPAYNEADRIAGTIAAAADFLAAQPFPTSLIIVDDGSTDPTAARAAAALADRPHARLISIPHAGKAAALRAGLSAATADQVAFSDADLATPLPYLLDLRAALATGCGIAIGSREGAGALRHGEPTYRHILGRGFNALVRLLLLPDIDDTQCGFKLFEQAALQRILPRCRLYRDHRRLIGPRVTAFDVELLVVGRQLGYAICAVPVSWTYGRQSKVQPVRDTWQNLRDVLAVRWNVWRGHYR